MNKYLEMSLLLAHWFLNIVAICCLVSAVVGAMYGFFTVSKIVILLCSYVPLAVAKLLIEERLPDKSKIIKIFDI